MIRNAGKFVVILMLVCLLMGVGVAVLYGYFRGHIAQREQATKDAAITAVVPEGARVDTEAPLAGDTKQGTAVYAARDAAGKLVAYVAGGEAPGYASVVKVVVGVEPAGEGFRIVRVAVLSQAETPGLGANIVETRSTYTLWQKLFGSDQPEALLNPFLDRFVGCGQDRIQDVQAITAATITSNATKAAVAHAIERIREAVKGRQSP